MPLFPLTSIWNTTKMQFLIQALLSNSFPLVYATNTLTRATARVLLFNGFFPPLESDTNWFKDHNGSNSFSSWLPIQA